MKNILNKDRQKSIEREAKERMPIQERFTEQTKLISLLELFSAPKLRSEHRDRKDTLLALGWSSASIPPTPTHAQRAPKNEKEKWVGRT